MWAGVAEGMREARHGGRTVVGRTTDAGAERHTDTVQMLPTPGQLVPLLGAHRSCRPVAPRPLSRVTARRRRLRATTWLR